MKDHEKLEHYLKGKLAAHDSFLKQAQDKPAVQRNCWEQVAVDWESRSFGENLSLDRSERRDRISPEELGALFDMTPRAVKGLPLQQFTPFEKTASGYRQVIRFHRTEVLTFLAARNPVYGLYNFDEPLLSPKQVVDACCECGAVMSTRKLGELRRQNRGPEYVELNAREIRYRLSDVVAWLENPDAHLKSLAPSEMIMEDCQ